ncbi:MAG TPA: hypothetical protein VGB95_05040 [Chitinophagales bacterium]
MRLFSKIISLIFHPLLFPTYGAIYITLFAPHFFAQLSAKAFQLSIIVIFILTFIFPMVAFLLIRKLEFVSADADDKISRTIPFIAIATFYIWTFFYYKPSYRLPFANPLIASMMLGATIAVFIAFFVNIFSKISLHAVGAGAWLGFALCIMKYTVYDTAIFFPFFVMIAGLIGTSRIALGKYNWREIAQGYGVGFVALFLAFNIAPFVQNWIN